MKYLFLFTSFLILAKNSYNQEFTIKQYRGELNVKLELIDEKRLEKAIEVLNSASLVEKEAIGILVTMSDTEKMEGISPAYKRMIKRMIDASQLYTEGHALVYTVYNENCLKFQDEMRKMNHYASGMNKAKYYERKGETTYKRANSIREILFEADKPEWMQYKMHEALELEKLSIRDKGRALQIYQDFPVEYNYGWDNDVSAEELKKFFKNPIVNLPPEQVFKKVPPEEKKQPEGGFVEFRVQIAAHTVELETDYIKTFYTGSDSVMEVREGNWFKYQIGKFDNFADANKLRHECRVPRAFVVAYQENSKLTIKEALAILQKNQ
jgi:hypothetical protein